MNVEMFEAVI